MVIILIEALIVAMIWHRLGTTPSDVYGLVSQLLEQHQTTQKQNTEMSREIRELKQMIESMEQVR